MPSYLSPGVYVEEVDSGARPIEGVGTAVAAFIGLAAEGRPTNPCWLPTGPSSPTHSAISSRAVTSPTPCTATSSTEAAVPTLCAVGANGKVPRHLPPEGSWSPAGTPGSAPTR